MGLAEPVAAKQPRGPADGLRAPHVAFCIADRRRRGCGGACGPPSRRPAGPARRDRSWPARGRRCRRRSPCRRRCRRCRCRRSATVRPGRRSCARNQDYQSQVRGRAGGPPPEDEDTELVGPPDYLRGKCRKPNETGPARLLADGKWCGHGETTFWLFDIVSDGNDRFGVRLPQPGAGLAIRQP